MITSALVDILDAAIAGLAKAVNLFAEGSSGDQCVSLNSTFSTPVANTIDPSVRSTRVQVIVKGWSMTDGEAMAENIVTSLKDIVGDVPAADGPYHVYGISFINLPTLISSEDLPAFSFNITVKYRIN